MTPQALDRLAAQQRYQIPAATVVEEPTERVDEVLDLFDIAMAKPERAARREHEETKASNSEAATETVRVFAQVAGVVLTVPDDQVGATILERIGRHRFEEVTAQAAEIDQRRDVYLDHLCSRNSRLRQFAPHLLAAFEFHAADDDSGAAHAVRLLTDLNSTRSRTVPPAAPTGFGPNRWQRYLSDRSGQLDRHAGRPAS